jgi:8-hydroxy-5-deazaflavin:NADPH oxidoreductase
VQGKVLIDATAPLRPPKVATVQLPPEGSAAKAAQDFLGAGVRVVSAFQDVAAHKLAELDREIDCDVLVTGNDQEAREQVIRLVEAAGLRGWHAGPIENSAAAEALTSILIAINRRYKIDGAGIRITGVPGGKT